jgi:hypothetical protein|nr:MAG TPA: YvrJ protein family protein [Caudoviricetes sp.]
MDLTQIGQYINQYGFPIVCCGVLFWDHLKSEQRRQEDNEMHKEEVAELRKSIESNTLAINNLCAHLGGTNNA